MPNGYWTIKDIEQMNIPVVEMTTEGKNDKWIVMLLKNGMRLVIRNWKVR